jgi:hypothetical protein
MTPDSRNPLSHGERDGVRGSALGGSPLTPKPLSQPSPYGRGLQFQARTMAEENSR